MMFRHLLKEDGSYTYDNASQVLTHTTDGVATTYGYDVASQLTSESRTGYSATYSYDGNGNRLTRNISGGVNETYSYDDGDKLTAVNWTGGSKTYGYDDAGRTTSVVSSAGTTNLVYDWESRLTSISGGGITAETYTYNGLDTRVSKTVSSVTTNYTRDGASVTAPVLRDSGASYTPGISERRGSTTTFNHSGIKNIDAQTGTAQTVAATRQYDAFGNTTASTGTWTGPFGNAGGFGYQEDATGLKLLGHRYYDSSTGRFITRDPIKDGRNWYAYGAGLSNPVSIADPTGLAYLTFDGSTITLWSDTGNGRPTIVASIPAVSGKPGTTNANQGDSSVTGTATGGPIPSGQYSVDPNLVGWQNWHGWGNDFRDSRVPWGIGRVPIAPKPGTNTLGRFGFFLHGGDIIGSGGCIDCGHGIEWFLNLVIAYANGKPMTLIVQYPSGGSPPVSGKPWPGFKPPRVGGLRNR